jgi:peptide/nickel transport system substrate-binding protein
VLEAFDEYWGEGPYVEQLTISEINDDTARVNALLSGQLEAINNVPASQLPVLRRASGIRQLVSPTGAIRAFVMNTTAKPFDDVRVRQAMRLILDREQMVKLALAGQGRVANDLFGPLDPCYNTGLPQRHQDIERAQFLLKQAGQEGLSVTLSTSDVAPGLLAASQIFAQQAKKAGVSVELRQVPASTYFSVAWLKDPFFVTYGATSAYLEYAAIATISSAPINETTFHDAQYDALYRRATAEADDRKRCGLIRQMMKIDYDRGGYIIWTHPNFTDAYSNKVRGFAPAKAWMPLTNFELNRVSFV